MMNDMNQNDSTSIQRPLRFIAVFTGISAITTAIFCTILTIVMLDYWRSDPSHRFSVVVAKTNLELGTKIQIDNILGQPVSEKRLPEGYICTRDRRVILGHTLVKPVRQDQPVTWYDLDVPDTQAILENKKKISQPEAAR